MEVFNNPSEALIAAMGPVFFVPVEQAYRMNSMDYPLLRVPQKVCP